MHRRGNALQYRRWIASGAYSDHGLGPRCLPKRHHNYRIRLVATVIAANSVKDANDLPLDRRSEFFHARNELLDDQALLQRIGVLEEFIGEVFIHHGDSDA